MELLVRIKDKVNDKDPYLDVKLTKRGDVIVACDDGHEWTKEELNNPEWRVVKCPDLSRDEAEAFLVPEPGDPKKNPMLRKRAFRIDVDALAKAAEFDPKEAAAAVDLLATDVRAVKVAKPPLTDPIIIGPQRENVIGPK